MGQPTRAGGPPVRRKCLSTVEWHGAPMPARPAMPQVWGCSSELVTREIPKGTVDRACVVVHGGGLSARRPHLPIASLRLTQASESLPHRTPVFTPPVIPIASCLLPAAWVESTPPSGARVGNGAAHSHQNQQQYKRTCPTMTLLYIRPQGCRA
jgi:hypothetical protein